ncbi:MAG: DUF4349 domain-containing protein [Bacilli bacterium]|nr:DUF4349 domain-containing protein [Bacilli bacterium]
MKKNYLTFIFLFLLSFIVFGCAVSDNRGEYDPAPGDETTEEKTVFSSERKMIYNVTASLYIEADFKEKIASLKASINDDEWTDYENISESSAHYTFRIKTTGLDQFVNSLSTYGEVRNINKHALDISFQYQDTSNQIITYEAEKTRLVELYDDANMSEIILINTRIAEIDKELRVLNGEIIQFDSLLEYSEVHLSIYNEAPKEDESYGQKLGQAFKLGINSLVKFFEVLSLVIVTIFPFAILFAAAGLGIYYLRQFYLKKKKNKLDKDEKRPFE